MVVLAVVDTSFRTNPRLVRSDATLPDTFTVDLGAVRAPPTGVTGDDAGVAWTRSLPGSADARIVSWQRQALFSSTTTWTIIEPDVGDATTLPALPARFDDLVGGGDVRATVTLLDIEPGDGYAPVRSDLGRLIGLDSALRDTGYDVGDLTLTTVYDR